MNTTLYLHICFFLSMHTSIITVGQLTCYYSNLHLTLNNITSLKILWSAYFCTAIIKHQLGRFDLSQCAYSGHTPPTQ